MNVPIKRWKVAFLRPCREEGGFTLIELMVVVALLAILMTITFPVVNRSMKRPPMDQAIWVLRQAFQTARLWAVTLGEPAEVVIRAEDGLVFVREARQKKGASDGEPTNVVGQEETASLSHRKKRLPGFEDHLPSSVAFRELQVNYQDRMNATEARIRFYPNGTCDFFSAVLFGGNGEERRIRLDIVTGQAIVEENL